MNTEKMNAFDIASILFEWIAENNITATDYEGQVYNVMGISIEGQTINLDLERI